MHLSRHTAHLALAVLTALALYPASAADWQFVVDSGVKNGRVFLWIPPDCDRVRGVILGQQVILEKCALEDPQVRAAAAREKLAIAFIVPAAIGYDEFGPEGKGAAVLQGILDRLAQASGYEEIAQAPFLTIGHSGGAIFAWRAAYWKPDRCFGIIGLHAAPIDPPAHSPKATVDGVPVLDITGQYESWGDPERSIEHHWRWVRGDLLAFRARWNRALMSELVQPGCSHFSWDEPLARHVALFIERAAQRRIPPGPPPAGQAPVLANVPLESGWLTDCTLMTPSRYPAAPYRDYTGDPSQAFWHLDGDLARATESYGAEHRGKELQMVTFVDDGKPLPSAWIEEPAFRPLEDGTTVKVQAAFVDETPPEFSFPAKRRLGHADGPIRFRLIGGWAGGGEQVGPDTFRIKYDRFCFSHRPGTLMIMAWHPGDEKYACFEQPASVNFPAKNTKGKPQQIAFVPPADLTIGAGPVTLQATSDSGLPVKFCVLAGPAEMEGNKLTLTAIPSRTKFPVSITVIAYQWGRATEPLAQSAEPVYRAFQVRGGEARP
jgi:hypothetical protein